MVVPRRKNKLEPQSREKVAIPIKKTAYKIAFSRPKNRENGTAKRAKIPIERVGMAVKRLATK
jgi:hypothetical protein